METEYFVRKCPDDGRFAGKYTIVKFENYAPYVYRASQKKWVQSDRYGGIKYGEPDLDDFFYVTEEEAMNKYMPIAGG